MKQARLPQAHRTRVRTDIVAAWPSQAMLGLLDRDPHTLAEGDPLPLGWHWLHFHEPARASALGADGHELRGGFMPDVDLPRRMWAGGTLREIRPVTIGARATLKSQVLRVNEKVGKSGRLVFVDVGHTVLQGGRRCVEEKRTIVYREAVRRLATARAISGKSATSVKSTIDARSAMSARITIAANATTCPTSSTRTNPTTLANPATPASPAIPANPATPAPPPSAFAWTETFLPTPVTLFQFSALTYNGHRIHYDHPYATEREGYKGLIVHGPLTALLLLDAARRHSADPVTRFRYRALAPLFADEAVTLAGRPVVAPHDRRNEILRARSARRDIAHEVLPPADRVVEAIGPSGSVAMRAWIG